jgi:hypothetical protein
MAVLSSVESKNLTRALITGVGLIAGSFLMAKVSTVASMVFCVLGILMLIARRVYMVQRISATNRACERVADAIGPELQKLVNRPFHIYAGDVIPVRVLAETVCSPTYIYAGRFIPIVNRIFREEGIPMQFEELASEVDSDDESEPRVRNPNTENSDLDSESDGDCPSAEPLTHDQLLMGLSYFGNLEPRLAPPKNPTTERAHLVRNLVKDLLF